MVGVSTRRNVTLRACEFGFCGPSPIDLTTTRESIWAPKLTGQPWLTAGIEKVVSFPGEASWADTRLHVERTLRRSSELRMSGLASRELILRGAYASAYLTSITHKSTIVGGASS